MITFNSIIPGSITRKDSKNGVITGEIAYQFFADAQTDNPWDVAANSFCPFVGAVHPYDWRLYCVDRSIVNADPWKGWTVSTSWSSEREFNEDPLQDPIEIEWDSEQFQVPLIVDRNGDAVLNSAGDPFDPPVMIDDSRRVVTVKKNLAAPPSWILSYQDAVNSDAFTLDGIPIAVGEAKLQRVSVGKWNYRNGVAFRTVNMVIHLQKNGWHQKPLDAGFRMKVTISGEEKRQLITMTNEDGGTEYPVVPAPLDFAGAPLADPTFTTCQFHDFEGYEELPFSVLPLT